MAKVRPVALSDAAEVLTMMQALSSFHGDVAEITFDDLLRDIRGSAPWVRVLVAEDRGRLVGYAALTPFAKLHLGQRGMCVDHLYVVEALRGRGIGRALLATCADLSRDLGCRQMRIGTAPGNDRAGEIYERFGFERFESTGGQYRMTLD